MTEPKQTLAREARFSGEGAHCGRNVRVTLKPSEEGRVVFRRGDLGGRTLAVDPLLARAQNCTLLSDGSASVRTVEHLLASLRMGGIDSVEIIVDGEEIPILDGSAMPLVRLIEEAGKKPLPEKRVYFEISKPLVLEGAKGSMVAFEAGPVFEVSYAIEYEHPAIGWQELRLRLDTETFKKEIAPARTFGFVRDAERLRALGLALGSSPENTVILDDERVINPPLRYPDEFVRHKILDLVGDLSLLGAPLRGRVRAVRAGHELHLRAVRALLQAGLGRE